MEKLQKLGGFDTVYPSHGTFPLKADKVEKQLEGAKLLLKGELEAKTPPFDIPQSSIQAAEPLFLY
jgi:hypothetical protein